MLRRPIKPTTRLAKNDRHVDVVVLVFLYYTFTCNSGATWSCSISCTALRISSL
jgi:hypothetical protein